MRWILFSRISFWKFVQVCCGCRGGGVICFVEEQVFLHVSLTGETLVDKEGYFCFKMFVTSLRNGRHSRWMVMVRPGRVVVMELSYIAEQVIAGERYLPG